MLLVRLAGGLGDPLLLQQELPDALQEAGDIFQIKLALRQAVDNRLKGIVGLFSVPSGQDPAPPGWRS